MCVSAQELVVLLESCSTQGHSLSSLLMDIGHQGGRLEVDPAISLSKVDTEKSGNRTWRWRAEA